MPDWSHGTHASLPVEQRLLSLPNTLNCGQAFRWRELPDGSWVGVVGEQAVRLSRRGGVVEADVYPEVADADALLKSYFRMDVDLAALYEVFEAADPWITSAIRNFAGLRVLRQEPRETLLSYVCSTANSVPRIAKAVDGMSRIYGRSIATLGGEEYFTFPTAEALAEASPAVLRNRCGLGWRGDNLIAVARQVAARPADWPGRLRSVEHAAAKAELMELRGIGAKIADCVCLFALDKDEAVPVDTHIWAVARELFGAHLPTRTLTHGSYQTISRLFEERYGRHAGWAQEYLFLQRRASQGRVRSEL